MNRSSRPEPDDRGNDPRRDAFNICSHLRDHGTQNAVYLIEIMLSESSSARAQPLGRDAQVKVDVRVHSGQQVLKIIGDQWRRCEKSEPALAQRIAGAKTLKL